MQWPGEQCWTACSVPATADEPRMCVWLGLPSNSHKNSIEFNLFWILPQLCPPSVREPRQLSSLCRAVAQQNLIAISPWFWRQTDEVLGRALFSDCLLQMTIEGFFPEVTCGLHLSCGIHSPGTWDNREGAESAVKTEVLHLHGWRNSSARWEEPGQGWTSGEQSFPSWLPAQYSVIPLPSENVRKDKREAVWHPLLLSARQGSRIQCRIQPTRRVGQFALCSGT